ncbi:AFG1/ZapE family ATPase [Luteimonas salinisoli]|uniref:AFG1/ZapE family ATPase n=1 Tax=Luteimonas salinisoli TaxID=2752307 RepID=UPI0031F3352C
MGVGGVPVLDATRDDAARRFVTLVDERYDSQVNLASTRSWRSAAAARTAARSAGWRRARASTR